MWAELHERLAADGARPLTEGLLIEKRVLDMHSYIVTPMTYGRLYLAGDAAHLAAPIAAKGMNLAIHDALLLGDALVTYSEMLHGASSGDSFRARAAAARLRRVLGSPVAAAAFTELYCGMSTECGMSTDY